MARRCVLVMLVAGAMLADGSAAFAQTLRELAERKDLKIGAMANDATWRTPQQKLLVTSEFNVVTVGTYWTRTHPARDQYDWSVTDELVAWADGAGLGVHLHPLLYPANEHNPQWVLDAEPADAHAMLEEFITTAMDHYRGVVDVWDVVNEAVRPSGSAGLRPCWWLDALGPGYIAEAYRIARRHDPTAVLLYNEHSIEMDNAYQTARWNTTKEILTELAAEDLVDGVGWQLHMTPEQVLDGGLALEERMQWAADLGLKNFVTELDMPIEAGDEVLARQGAAYQRLAEIWLEHNGGGWFQTWGVYDKYSWLGPGKRPLMFDETYQPKPAYEGVRAALEAGTSADFDGDGDVDGDDLLEWQRRPAPDPADLESFRRQYPVTPPPADPQGRNVPEGHGVLLACWAVARLLAG